MLVFYFNCFSFLCLWVCVAPIHLDLRDCLLLLQVGVVSDYDLLALDSISGNIKGMLCFMIRRFKL